MDPFEELKDVAEKQSKEGEFPSWLLADVVDIADNRERYGGGIHLVELLVAQIANYDTYAGAGCFDSSVSAATIEATIKEIRNYPPKSKVA